MTAAFVLPERKGERALDASDNSPAELERELEARTQELTEARMQLVEARDRLAEALEQQPATSEVLSVISTKTGDLQPVFDKTPRNPASDCRSRKAGVGGSKRRKKSAYLCHVGLER